MWLASIDMNDEITVNAKRMKDYRLVPPASVGRRVCRVTSLHFYIDASPAGATEGTQVIVAGNWTGERRHPVVQATYNYDAVGPTGPGLVGSRPLSSANELTFPRDEVAFMAGVRGLHFAAYQPLWLRYSNNTDAAFEGTVIIRVQYIVLDSGIKE